MCVVLRGMRPPLIQQDQGLAVLIGVETSRQTTADEEEGACRSCFEARGACYPEHQQGRSLMTSVS